MTQMKEISTFNYVCDADALRDSSTLAHKITAMVLVIMTTPYENLGPMTKQNEARMLSGAHIIWACILRFTVSLY